VSDPARRQARLGMASMTLAMALFSINDAFVKAVASDLPVAQIMGVRGVFATLGVLGYLAIARPAGAFAGLTHPLVTVRSLAETLAIVCLIMAFARIPIGDATAISQSVPLVLLPAAAIFLKEKIAPVQWLLVMLGFLGVVLIAKPFSGGFDPAIGLAIITAILFAFRDLTARQMPSSVSSSAVTLSTVAVVMIAAGTFALVRGVVPMSGTQVGMLAVAGLLLAWGQAAVILAFRLASVADAGPFNYTKTAFALVVGIVAFGEWPDLFSITGGVLVVASGLAIALGLGRRA
jgi:drug/metabolite transporter (DMT)-like permease